MIIISMFEHNKLCLHRHLSRDFVQDALDPLVYNLADYKQNVKKHQDHGAHADFFEIYDRLLTKKCR